MTKERLKRLLNVYALYEQRAEMTDDQLIDYGALMDEFGAWDPDAIEREREEARGLASRAMEREGRYGRIFDAAIAQRDEARDFAREVFLWADSYVPDSGWGEGWAEVVARSRALDWLRGDQ